MLMYNLLEYSGSYDIYSMTSGSLRNCYIDETNYDANWIDANRRINNSKTVTSRSFEHKTNITGSMPADNNLLDTEVVLLKYLGNFWRSLDLPLSLICLVQKIV